LLADSNIEKLRTSSSDEDDEYYDAEGIFTLTLLGAVLV